MSGTDAHLCEAAAAAAVRVFQDAGLEASRQGAKVAVEQLAIEVRAIPEAAQQQGGRHVVAVRFELDVPGVPPGVFTAGVVGMGAQQEQAVAESLQSWAMVQVAPLADALRGDGVRRTYARGGPTPAIEVAGFEAYVGPIELRSLTETPPGFSRAELLSVLEGDLEHLDGQGLHTVGVVRTGGTQPACEVRLDGEVHLGMTAAAAGLGMGMLTGDWLLKAFVVLRPITG